MAYNRFFTCIFVHVCVCVFVRGEHNINGRKLSALLSEPCSHKYIMCTFRGAHGLQVINPLKEYRMLYMLFISSYPLVLLKYSLFSERFTLILSLKLNCN